MNEWRVMHSLTMTSASSTMSAQLKSITMSTSTEETPMTMKEARSSQDEMRYISGKLVVVQKMSTLSEEPSMTTKESAGGNSISYDTKHQNCCTVLLTDTGKICTKF